MKLPSGYVIFTGTNCYRCDMVKQKFKKHNVPFIEFNVRENEQAYYFLKTSGFHSIPQIYLDGKHIGKDVNFED